MSRVCVVGFGDPSFLRSRYHAGPGLRCGHFAGALAESGHELLVLHVVAGPARVDSRACAALVPARRHGSARLRSLAVAEDDFDHDRLHTIVSRFAPDALVGVTAHAAWLATRLDLNVPLWADIFGDLMSEAQAKASVHGNDASLVHFWSVLGPVLEAADRFSAVSQAQADALVGQLGLAGRLSSATAGEDLVTVIPCAAEAPVIPGNGSDPAGLRGRVVAADAFVVLWSGGFNTWCDVDTLFDALECAMTEHPAISFVATGGLIRGHDERTHARFASRVASSRLRDRFHLLGWVSDDELSAIVADADVGIHVERDIYERRLGAENRIVHWMVAGLPAVTTARSELGRELAARDLVFAVPVGDSAAIARVLVELAGDRGRVDRLAQSCRSYAAGHFGYSHTARRLIEWCHEPCRSGDSGKRRALSLGLLSEPKAMVHLLEAYLAELTLRQVAFRSLRWLSRRLTRRFQSPLEPRRPAD